MMKDERMQILRMLEEGKVSSEEAFQLLSTLEQKPAPSTTSIAGRNKFLRIKVQEGGDRTRVNVNVPMSLVKIVQRFIPAKVKSEFPDLDLEAIVQDIEQGAQGKIVEVTDKNSDTTVEISVE